MNIVMSSNPEILKDSISGCSGTVEAEYGDTLVEGSAWTLAHHGPRSGNPAPCLAESGSLSPVTVIGISHFDLDTLMGIGIAMGRRYFKAFAAAAAFIDTNGVHRAGAVNIEGWEGLRPFFNAFWAWSEDNRLFPPRDGSVMNCTDFIEGALDTLDRILVKDEELFKAGEEWAEAKAELNSASFLGYAGPYMQVIKRSSGSFVNHLYNDPESGQLAGYVVALNPERGSVTVSAEDGGHRLSMRELVQGLWGVEAGGHDGIAGSPRGATFGEDELSQAAEALADELKKLKEGNNEIL